MLSPLSLDADDALAGQRLPDTAQPRRFSIEWTRKGMVRGAHATRVPNAIGCSQGDDSCILRQFHPSRPVHQPNARGAGIALGTGGGRGITRRDRSHLQLRDELSQPSRTPFPVRSLVKDAPHGCRRGVAQKHEREAETALQFVQSMKATFKQLEAVA